MRALRPRLIALAPLLLLHAAVALGQDHPNHRHGGEVPTAYALGQIEAVNLWNGNLTLAIPLGLSYPVGGGLSYQLSLHYNSTVWEFEEGPVNNQSQPTVTATPDPHSRAGLGWVLEFGGRLYAPQTPLYNDSTAWVLIEPDGTRRIWEDKLHDSDPQVHVGDGVLYTRDGSYLRLNTQLFQWLPPGEPPTWKVESPDGTIRHFGAAGNLRSIRDRFNNSVTVTPLNAQNPSAGWQIRDSVGGTVRTHIINQQMLAGLPQSQVVDIRLAKFGGGEAVYSFEYELDGTGQPIVIQRHSKHTADGALGGEEQTTRMPLLKRVTLPDGSKFAMTYYTAEEAYLDPQGESVVNMPGMLRTFTLPTLGTYEWKYRIYGFGTPVSPTETWYATNEGVLYKTASSTIGGPVVGIWKYAGVGRPDGTFPVDQNREHTRWVTDPLGFTTVHYFENNEVAWNHGLPFTTQITDAATGKFLSRQVYAGAPSAGTLRRSEYVTFESDSVFGTAGRDNQRLRSQKTIFNDDGNRFSTVDHSGFDGLGHYRTTILGGNFDAGNTKTTFRKFNSGRGDEFPTSFTMVTTAEPWLLGLYDETKVTEGTQSFHTRSCFNADTGFLDAERTLETTGSTLTYGGRDLLMRATATAQGDVEREEFFGGDVDPNPLPIAMGSPCASGSNTRDYALRHTYSMGALASSRYLTVAGADMPFLIVDRTNDQATGLPSSSRDTATLPTQFEYDDLGRLRFVKPVGSGAADGWTEYVYSPATGSTETTVARVEILHRDEGGGSVLAKEVQRFDAFGRPWQEEKLMRNGSTAKRRTLYNGLGWPESVTSMVTAIAVDTPKTEYLNYDPFGRAAKIVAPDGGDITLGYFGARRVTRTLDIGSLWDGISSVTTQPTTTTEFYDRQGRLWQLREPSGTGGAIVITQYSYNALGKLVEATTGAQTRSFVYDGRGLLKSESHPEKQPGPGESADVVYKEYDARGHTLRVVDGQHDLRTSYDAAERLDEVRETGSNLLLEKLVYGTTNGTNDWRKGKLQSATRHNHFSQCAQSHNAQVLETYTYGGRMGRVSRRDLALVFDGASGESFSQTFSWTPLGRPHNVGYPECKTGAGGVTDTCQAPSPRSVESIYANGWLSQVTGFATSLGYHANGLVATVNHSNGINDVQDNDPESMARPLRHFAVPAAGGARLWDSGAYDYDEAGNVTRMGNAYFLYDKVSRLKDGHISTDPLGALPLVFQTTSYDSFGNILSFGGTSSRSIPTDSATNRLCTSACGGTASYSACGELLGWNSQVYEYDHFGMLRRSQIGAEEWLHFYTADDERVWSYRVGATPYNRWTLRDLAGRVLREYASDNAGWRVVSDYIYRDGQMLAAVTPTETKHFHLDHLGTPRAISTPSGTKFHAYYPFGEEATSSTQDSERLRFTGHEIDFNVQSGMTPQGDDLNYMHARQHSPITGRFLSVDPKGRYRAQKSPQALNRYAYTRGNPLKHVDPNGKDAMLVVRNDSGGGKNNYGHTALRVFGKGYDFTYDFGRYGATRGPLNSQGDGMLRVWSNFSRFQAGQAMKGDLNVRIYKTTPAQDAALMDFFNQRIEAGTQTRKNSNYTEFKLAQDYDLLSNNCTTICIDALEAAEAETGVKFDKLDKFSGEYNPLDLYEKLDELFGRGNWSIINLNQIP